MINPEAQAVLQSEYSHDSERSILEVKSLEAWRESEEARRNAALGYQDGNPFDLKKEFDDSIDTSLDNYLSQRGLSGDSDQYDTVRSLYRNASIDKISDTEWFTSPSSRGELFYNLDADVPAREVFARQISDMKSEVSNPETDEKAEAAYDEALDMNAQFDAAQAAAATSGSGEDVENAHTEALLLNERFDALQTELPNARKEVAHLATKIGPNADAYIEAKQNYDAKVIELGWIQFSDSRKMYDQMSDAERAHFKVNVTKYIFEEQAALRQATDDNLQGTRRGRFIKRVGDWMNQGNKATRFAKGIGVGTAVAVAAGATFGVGAVPAVGLIAGYRGFTTYARRDKREIAKFTDTDKTALGDTVNQDELDALGRGYDSTAARYDKDAKEQRKARRKAVAWGAGSAAVTLAFGVFGHYLGEGIHSLSAGSAHGMIDHNTFNGTGRHIPTGQPNLERYLPGQGPHHIPEMTHGSGHVGDGIHGGHDTSDYFSGHNGTTEFSTGGAHNFESWMNGAKGAGYTVKPGDTIWGLSQKYLESQGVKHPSIYQTDAVKDQMLKAFQAKGLADHRGWLTAGAKVKF